MEEIKVGEYVRDIDGFIVKVNEIQDYKEDDDIWYEEKTLKGTWKSMVVKHSKNIIDLIKEGDYVNGYFCRYITDIDTGEEHLCNYDLNEMRWIPLEDIDIWERVVTKEQFKSMEYNIGE